MIIDPNNNSVYSSSVSTSRTRNAQAVDKNQAAERPEKPSSDSVSLSSKGQTLGRLEAKIADAPEVDEAKVAQVKAAIAEGRYRVDSQTVADRILRQDSLLNP